MTHGVDCRNPIPGWSCATPPTEGFSVHEGIALERLSLLGFLSAVDLDAIHAALAGGTGSEGLENHVGKTLAGEGVTGVHGSSAGRRQDSILWNDDVCRVKTSLVQRDIFVNHGSQTVNDGRVHQTLRSISVAVSLRVCAGKVKIRSSCFWVDAYFEVDLRSVVQVIDRLEGLWVDLGYPLQVLSDCYFGGFLDCGHVSLHRPCPVLGKKFLD